MASFISHVRSKRLLLIVATIIASGLFVVLEPSRWLSRLEDETTSPNCHYRLEMWTTFFSRDDGFVRLYEATTGHLIAESDVIFLIGNLETFWPRSAKELRLGIGMDIVIPLAV
jgi:hypothetical protein